MQGQRLEVIIKPIVLVKQLCLDISCLVSLVVAKEDSQESEKEIFRRLFLLTITVIKFIKVLQEILEVVV